MEDNKNLENKPNEENKPDGEQLKPYEEIVAELNKSKAEVERLRVSIDRTSSEAADYKRKYREKLNEEEQAQEARKEHDEYVKGLELKIKTNDAFKRYTDLGMSSELAMETAQFDVEGDTENVFKNMKAFQSSLLEAEKSKWLQNRPDVHSGHNESPNTSDDDDPFLKGFNS